MKISDEATETLGEFFEETPGFLFVSLHRDKNIYKISFDPIREPPSELFFAVTDNVLVDADAGPYLDGAVLDWDTDRQCFFIELPEGTVESEEAVAFTFH